MTAADSQPPRALYAIAMLCAALAATACAWFVAGRVALGEQASAAAAAAVVGGACVVGFLPAFLGGAGRFGVMVLAASVGRLLLVLIGATLLTEIAGHPRRPVWIGAASGAAIALIIESVLAIKILVAIERSRHSGKAGGPSPAEQESGVTC